MLIAQLTDIHLGIEFAAAPAEFSPTKRLVAAVEYLNELQPRPDVVLLTGDLTADGEIAQYRMLGEQLSGLHMPYYLLPGNHDDRDNLRLVFADRMHLYQNKDRICFAIERFMTTRSDSANGSGVRIIGLDTLEPGNHGGRLGATQLAWLDSTLATQTTTATAIFMHHPPFKTHMPVFDAMGCVDGDALGDVVKRHPQVQLVASGHVHRSVQTLWCGTLAIALSSATFQYPLYLQTTDQALQPDFITGVVGLSVWSSDGQVVAHEKLIAPE